jgi:hypothetical protein
MNSTCFVTLQKRAGGKILVSPEFTNGTLALDFLHGLLEDLSYFLQFYAYHDKYSFYNDDFILAVESEEACLDFPVEIEDSSVFRIQDLSLEAVLNFIEEKKFGE